MSSSGVNAGGAKGVSWRAGGGGGRAGGEGGGAEDGGGADEMKVVEQVGGVGGTRG